jgi:apoptosis-inducing factor 3
LIHDTSKIEIFTAADLKIKFGANIRTGVVSVHFLSPRRVLELTPTIAFARFASLRKIVKSISLPTQTVIVSNGFSTHLKDTEEIGFDHLVLAPGSFARRLPIEGAQEPKDGGKENVFTLRGVSDVRNIVDGETGSTLCFAGALIRVYSFAIAAKEGARVVVIGSSFIAMELVLALSKRKLGAINVISMDEVPFQNVLGEEIGRALMEVSSHWLLSLYYYELKLSVHSTTSYFYIPPSTCARQSQASPLRQPRPSLPAA